MVLFLLAALFISYAEVPENNTFMPEYVPPFAKKMEKQKNKMEKNMQKKACPSFLDPIECELMSRVNMHRTRNGLHPLVPAEKCTNLAHQHTQYMVALSNKGASLQKSLNHDRFKERIDSSRLNGGKVSENVAAGTNLMPEQVLSMWLKSSGHKQNIMDGDVTYTGLSAIKDAKGNIFWTQCFSSKK